MDDKDLKRFLRENQKNSKAPSQEWSTIVNEIEKPKNNLWMNIFNFKMISVFSAVFAFVIVIGVNVNNTYSPKQTIKTQAIEEFLAEDSYFDEQQTSYSWVDES